MIKTLLLLHQILIQVRKEDVIPALQAHHSLQLHSHLLGSQLTLEMLLKAPPSNIPVLIQNNQPEWLKPIPEDDKPATLEPAWVIPTSHIPDAVNNWANALATTYQALAENLLLDKTGDMQMFMNWYCQNMGKTGLTQAELEGQAYEVVKALYPDVALSISKMKAARYHEFGLELLVPEHMWINDVYTYDISASYGISHWWFNCQKFYIADTLLTQAARYDFEDLNLLLLKGHLNHLPGSENRMLSTVVNIWDAKGYEYKHDYTIIESPRAVVFTVCNNERKIMRFNEIYKFSDGTLTNFLEALEYRVKEYKVNRLNP
ncbi:hypothetical protein Tco_0443464, partial [Tanacetum coccineum]